MAMAWTTGIKRIAGRTYSVIKRFGSWLIIEGGKIVAAFIRGVVYAFAREVGRSLARRIFAAPPLPKGQRKLSAF